MSDQKHVLADCNVDLKFWRFGVNWKWFTVGCASMKFQFIINYILPLPNYPVTSSQSLLHKLRYFRFSTSSELPSDFRPFLALPRRDRRRRRTGPVSADHRSERAPLLSRTSHNGWSQTRYLTVKSVYNRFSRSSSNNLLCYFFIFFLRLSKAPT